MDFDPAFILKTCKKCYTIYVVIFVVILYGYVFLNVFLNILFLPIGYRYTY